jgi:benzoyl-CoA reductase/2-hydroxyglutaryl-CoA dehydratase subunit BcrC/BadD/HgdB
MIDPFHIDGVVYHPIKSCRTVSTGLADNRRADGFA